MAVVRSKQFKCEACEHEFESDKFYVLRHTKDGETESSRVTACPECKARVQNPDEFVIQQGVVKPLCPKTNVKTIIKDRQLWY